MKRARDRRVQSRLIYIRSQCRQNSLMLRTQKMPLLDYGGILRDAVKVLKVFVVYISYFTVAVI